MGTIQSSPQVAQWVGADAGEEVRRRSAIALAAARAGLPFNFDQWDGYPVARERLYAAMTAAKASPIVLSGDSHAFWANELHDAGGARVAAEFGATGVTSPGIGDVLAGAPLNEALVERNKEVRYTDHAAKGFVLLTLTREAATGRWWRCPPSSRRLTRRARSSASGSRRPKAG